MIRKRTLLIALTVLAVSLTSCSASRSESEDAEGSVLVVENSSEIITVAEEEMTAADAVDETVVGSVDETLGEVYVSESDEEADDERDLYLKEIPPYEETEITLGDTSYKDELTDQLLIDEADSLFDQGYLIIGAETLAKNGACLTDQEGKYFYRGFLAANGNLEVPELRYYYIIPEDLMWNVIDSSSSYVSSYTMSETKIEFELVDDNETLVYDREKELLVDVMYK